MTVIFGTLKDVGGQLAQGTVTVSSLVTRPAHGGAETVITKERHVLPLRNGAFESPELDPGPVLIEAASGGAFESWEVTLPEDGRHDLATLIETHVEYAPAVVGRVEAAAADANRAAQAAGLSATRAGEVEQRVIVVESRIDGIVADGAAAVRAELQSEIAGVDQARVDAQSAQAAAEAAAASAAAAAGRAEAARDQAAASAEATAVDAAEVGEAREFVSGVHESLSPGGATTALFEGLTNSALSAASQAGAARDAAQGHADRAEAAAAGVDQVISDAADALRVEVADDVAAAQAARTGAEAARDEASGMLAQKADLVGGVVPSSQIPAVAMTRPHVVADVAGLLALDVQEGDVGIIPDGPDRGSYMLGTGPASEFSSWKRLVTPEAPVSSVNGQTGTVTLGAADVGAATASHTHTTSQITDLPLISAYPSPHHLVQRDNKGNINVPGIPGSPSHPASKYYVDREVETRATVAEVQARPAMWLWDGQGTWSAPPGAVDTDTVLNTATGEIHTIVEVTA